MQNKILVGRTNSASFWNPVFHIVYHWNNNIHENFIKYCSTRNCIFHCFLQEFQSKRDNFYLYYKKLLDEECTMIQGLKQVLKVTKIIFSYFKRTQRQFRNPVRHTIWTPFVKKGSIVFKLLTIITKT